MTHPMSLYHHGLLAESDGGVSVRTSDGVIKPLAIDRYLAGADAVDRSLLSSVEGPVLDVGCGPGRHLSLLAKRGVFGLGVDLSPVAVKIARDRGAQAIVGSVFDELPGTGTWRTALLIDGNIGIGGSPVRLLARIVTLLAEDGELLVELDPPGTSTGAIEARLESETTISSWFPWATVAYEQVAGVAAGAGLRVEHSWELGERWFARLVR